MCFPQRLANSSPVPIEKKIAGELRPLFGTGGPIGGRRFVGQLAIGRLRFAIPFEQFASFGFFHEMSGLLG